MENAERVRVRVRSAGTSGDTTPQGRLRRVVSAADSGVEGLITKSGPIEV